MSSQLFEIIEIAEKNQPEPFPQRIILPSRWKKVNTLELIARKEYFFKVLFSLENSISEKSDNLERDWEKVEKFQQQFQNKIKKIVEGSYDLVVALCWEISILSTRIVKTARLLSEIDESNFNFIEIKEMAEKLEENLFEE